MKDNDRDQIRQVFFSTWKKYKTNQLLEPLENQIISVILQHPEYQTMLDNPEKYLAQDYAPEFGETNPFLHMGLHLSILEQVSTDRPAGIRDVYQILCNKLGSTLAAEHVMMDSVLETLWQMQRNDTPITDEDYLQKIKDMINKMQ